MKPSDNLFLLIKTLSKSEKKYFKRFCLLHGAYKKNNYIKLFDYLEKQKVYNESKLKLYFKNENFINHLSVAKDYLYKLVLKTLVLQKSSFELFFEMKESVQECSILLSRGMYSQCRKHIKKTREILKKYGFDILNLELIGVEKNALSNLSLVQKEAALERIMIEEKKVIHQISLKSEITNLKRKVMINISHMGMPVRNENDMIKLNRIIKILEKQNVTSVFSKQTMSVLSHTKIAAFMAVADYLNAYKESLKLLKLLRSSNEILLNDPKNMYGALHNMVFLTLNLKKKKKSIQYLNVLKNYIDDINIKNTIEIDFNLYLNYFILLLRADNTFFNMEYRTEKILQYKEFCLKNKNYINQVYYVDSLVILVINYILHSEWDKALVENNYLINLSKEYLSREQYFHSYINSFIIHYELKNFDLLENLLNKFKKIIKNYKSSFEIEALSLKYFNKLINSNDNTAIKLILEEFKEVLINYKQTPFLNQIVNDYFLIEWIDTKIGKK